MRHQPARRRGYRVWLVGRTGGTGPLRANQVAAIRPLIEGTLARRAARQYVQRFNTALGAERQLCWAVAVPVEVQYAGDLCAGSPVVR